LTRRSQKPATTLASSKTARKMTNLAKSTDESAHQTVTEFIKLQTPEETIQIGFTEQKVSGRASFYQQWPKLLLHGYG
jgi:hypothetical protein